MVPTAGKREAGAPAYSYGASIRGFINEIDVGLTAKRTGGRYLYDTNLPLVFSAVEVYPAKTNAYWLVNADARFSLKEVGLDKTYLQLNIYNLFDALYVGNFNTSLNQSGSAPNAQIGAPRTFSGTLNFQF